VLSSQVEGRGVRPALAIVSRVSGELSINKGGIASLASRVSRASPVGTGAREQKKFERWGNADRRSMGPDTTPWGLWKTAVDDAHDHLWITPSRRCCQTCGELHVNRRNSLLFFMFGSNGGVVARIEVIVARVLLNVTEQSAQVLRRTRSKPFSRRVTTGSVVPFQFDCGSKVFDSQESQL